MSEENKKTTTENKILSFHISDEDILNPEMDHFMLHSLKKEADELEARLNADPSLAGVEAPEGLFQSIVDELKAQGVWREEGEDGGSVEPGGSRDSVGSRESAGSGESGGSGESAGTPETPDAVYDMLSEEDRRALELGRRVGEKQQKRAERRRKRHGALKIAGVIAAMVVLVFGVSMTSEANRRLVMKMWDGMLVDFGFKVNTNYSGEKEIIRSKSKEELAAIEDIREKLGGQMIELGYLPEGMYFENYDIKKNINEAMITYSYRKKFFYITILNMDKEGSAYYTYDEDAVFKETLNNDYHITAKVWQTNLELQEETYIAEIEYNGWRYVFNGVISLDEMKKILKYSFIL